MTHVPSNLTIGEVARGAGLPVRTVRFYADEGVVPEADRTEAGYRVFDAGAVARLRLVRTLRDLGLGLDDVRRVLESERSLADVAAAHVDALDARIRTLRLQRSILSAIGAATEPKELEQMTDLATMTAEERRRILDDYLDAVFGDDANAVADKLRMGTPELPEDPTPDQVAAWVELAELLRDPDYVARSREMADRAKAEGPEPDVAQFEVGKAVGAEAGAALRDGIDPASDAALTVVKRLEAMGSGDPEPRAVAAERIETFTDRRVARYWTLVGIINGWPQWDGADSGAVVDAWEWYAAALRAHG